MFARLLYIIPWLIVADVTAQPFPARKVNEKYSVSGVGRNDVFKTNLHKIIRDKNGLYWFQSTLDLYSFDGVNWKSYQLQSAAPKTAPVKYNDIELAADNSIWLASSEGIYILDRSSEKFVSARLKYPEIKHWPPAVSCLFQGPDGKLIFISMQREGFYLFDQSAQQLKHIIIDDAAKVFIPADNISVVTDKRRNVWGITSDNKGIWHYDFVSGQIRCSWKGELPLFSGKRYQLPVNLTYVNHENAIWVSFKTRGYLEKIYLETTKRSFYSFAGNLTVYPDTISKNRHTLFAVKTSDGGGEWVNVGKKYLVKLNNDFSRLEYLTDDPDSFPLGRLDWFLPEVKTGNQYPGQQAIDLWIYSKGQIAVVNKMPGFIRHIPFDTISQSRVKPGEYVNPDARQNIFISKGDKNRYYLWQQNPGRPKLICFDSSFRFQQVVLTNEWKQYPAYFNTVFDADTCYIAILRPGIEPIDFRNVVLKDFRIDLRSFKVEELQLSFKQRVWRYGVPDADAVYWLYSAGFLYSYDPEKDRLDSLFICQPAAKGSYQLELVKGYDYPTILHKNSATFWIDFIPSKELYKINLKTKTTEKVFKCCLDQTDCSIPGGVFDMYSFDQRHIYLQLSYSSMLMDVKNDSLTDFSGLFQKKIIVQNPSGAGKFSDWVYLVFPSKVYLLNTQTGQKKELNLLKDYKWPLSQFNSAPLVNEKGEMILMAANPEGGFLVLPVEAALAADKPGTVLFSSVEVDNQQLPADSLLKAGIMKLKFNGYSRIHFRFSDRSIVNQDLVHYEYALHKGGDTSWNKIEGEPSLTFSDLSPGKYQLLIRAVNDLDEKSDNITALRIAILPPFWQQQWFIVLCFLLLFSGLVFYLQWRIQTIRKKERAKTALARQMAEMELQSLRAQLNPHFMFNSLNAIQELILKEDFEKSHTYLARFAKLLRMLLENADQPFVSLHKETDFLELYLSLEKLRLPELEFSITIDPLINPVETHIPNMILQPYIENAIWHGLSHKQNDKKIWVNIFRNNGAVYYEIKDNGVGRKKAAELKGMYRKQHRSKGMELLTKRFKLMQEEFSTAIQTVVYDLHSESGAEGTVVTIAVPDSISYFPPKNDYDKNNYYR